MKIELKKHNMTRWFQENQLDQAKSAGWTEIQPAIKAVDEVIRLKPPVKTKATVTASDEANINKGDE